MYFDGASHRSGAGAGVIFVSPEGDVLPYAFTLTQNCSNNEAEYQALILGLEMAVDAKHLELKVYGDSMLIINQLLDIYEVRKPELVPFNNYARRLIAWLGDVTLEHVPRGENRQADALAKLASTLALPDHETHVSICRSWVIPPIFESEDNGEREVNVVSVLEIETEDWRQPIIDYLQHGKLPDDPHRRTDVKRRAPRFIYYKDTLYRRSFEGLFLRCLGENEAKQALEEAHSGKGDLVLAVRRPINTTHKIGGKFISKWDGPYVVQEVYSSGAYKLVAEDGLRVGSINGKFLKRYYP
ncbi:hypothetical protein RHGRI_011664 [Rhododendron griersonianum]|uniref:RNase H type-1 domain-containing protein n=1 Tax=Rhododendron griersonianum TaxID=479676 RepID=A0AAV6KMT4_9ERIC|nr:hypothetical protein RHGRI_011664 [Rhododendron griersonianum]